VDCGFTKVRDITFDISSTGYWSALSVTTDVLEMWLKLRNQMQFECDLKQNNLKFLTCTEGKGMEVW
jgi:hypothetical protein